LLKKLNLKITPLEKWRTIHLYLPKDYENSEERYPVLYMYDGHNLFEDSDATYGKSWGLGRFLDSYDKHFLVVGIECDHEGNNRLCEYFPYVLESSPLGPIKGYGDVLMDWVIRELKPLIDGQYRTIPFRECTMIGGSSMGGLMALYSVIKYNRFFSKAACLSSAISWSIDQLEHEITSSDLSPDTRIYFSWGTKEFQSINALEGAQNQHHRLMKMLKESNVKTYLNQVNGGRHCEEDWEKEIPVFMDFLWKDGVNLG